MKLIKSQLRRQRSKTLQQSRPKRIFLAKIEFWIAVLGILLTIYGTYRSFAYPNVQVMPENSIFETMPFEMPFVFENESSIFSVYGLTFTLNSVSIIWSDGSETHGRVIAAEDWRIAEIPKLKKKTISIKHFESKPLGFSDAKFYIKYKYHWFFCFHEDSTKFILRKDSISKKYAWQYD